ncbi:MAG: peptide ABC transporter substrate-binding protein [Opitutaceae bacterium]|nr:peptide ABC transporter substrate-binding protein [Opitutaceae bacterium]|tara:strand:- start:2481 stop:4094 length:1614 start_codon:yes stop_codon:yes gene_type:complete
MINRTCFAATLVIVTFISIACIPRERAVDAGIKTQTIHIANGAEPQTLDPHVVTGIPEDRIVRNIFEGLVVLNPDTVEPAPGSAERWEVLDGGRQFRFHLRKNLRWSNGDPITAHDFHYSMNRVLSPTIANPYIIFFEGLTNAIAYHEGKVTDFDQVGVKVIDDHTLDILMDEPSPVLLSYMTGQYFYPVHKESLEKYGKMDERGTPWFRPGNIVSNGAFNLKEWITNTHVLLEPNPHYWDAESVRLKNVFMYPIESFDTQNRAFQNGQVHVAHNLPQHIIMELEKERPPEYISHIYLGTYYYAFNNNKTPLDNPKVRRALSMAINREQIVKQVAQGGQQPAYSFVPPGANGYQPDYQLEENLEESRKLLSEAGYPNGQGFPVLSVLFNTSENHRRIAEAIHQMWKNGLGIDIELQNMEWKVYLETRDRGDFEISRAAWVGGDDHAGYLDILVTGSGNNDTKWSNFAFDELYKKSATIMDPELRIKTVQQAEAIMLKEMPIAPIYFYTVNYLVDTRVKGWDTNSVDRRFLKDVYLEE